MVRQRGICLAQRWFQTIGVLQLALSLWLVTPAAPVLADTSVGVIVELTGAAEVRSRDSWQPISVGSSVVVGSALRTGPESLMRAVFYDGSSLSFERDTEVVIDEHSFDSDSGHYRARIRLVRGKIRPTVEPQDGKTAAFEIAADSVTADADGADFIVEFDEPSAVTKVTSLRGQVAIHSSLDPSNSDVLITARQVTSVKRGEAPAPARAADRLTFSQAGAENGVLGSSLPDAAIWSHLLGPIAHGHDVTSTVLQQQPLNGTAEARRANSVSSGNDMSSLTGRPANLPGQLDFGIIVGHR